MLCRVDYFPIFQTLDLVVVRQEPGRLILDKILPVIAKHILGPQGKRFHIERGPIDFGVYHMPQNSRASNGARGPEGPGQLRQPDPPVRRSLIHRGDDRGFRSGPFIACPRAGRKRPLQPKIFIQGHPFKSACESCLKTGHESSKPKAAGNE
jgi:hypothetical protein